MTNVETLRVAIQGLVLLAALACITVLGVYGAVDEQAISVVFGAVVGAVGAAAGTAVARAVQNGKQEQ